MKLETARDIVIYHDCLIDEGEEYTHALKTLRGNDWRTGVEHDERKSVMLLYAELKRVEKSIVELLDTNIQVICTSGEDGDEGISTPKLRNTQKKNTTLI